MASLMGCQQSNSIRDGLYYDIWFEFLMYFDINTVKANYAKNIEKSKSEVNAEELRAAGYSEEDIAKAVF